MLRDGMSVRAVNRSGNVVVAERAVVAARSWSRARGLLGSPALKSGEGLVIVPCRGVHTLGMAYPIDVVHLDREGVVLAVIRHLRPWRFGPLVWDAYLALELPADTAWASTGDRIELQPLNG